MTDFASTEFAAVIAREVRMRLMTPEEGRAAFEALDAWIAQAVQAVALTTADVVDAITWLRRLDLNLRAPDALHLATASRLSLPILTFDAGMATAAHALNLALAEEP